MRAGQGATEVVGMAAAVVDTEVATVGMTVGVTAGKTGEETVAENAPGPGEGGQDPDLVAGTAEIAQIPGTARIPDARTAPDLRAVVKLKSLSKVLLNCASL